MLQTPSPPRLVTLVILSGLAALSLNIFLPSLPGMARHFDAPYAQMQIAVSGYLAVSALAQLLIGPISDRFGRRPVQLAVLAIFVLAVFVGYYVVWRVTPALHSPLMAVTNAVSSVIIVGALLAAGLKGLGAAQLFGFIAVALAAVNIFGGFIVTHRMLSMFKKKQPVKK